MIDPEGNQLGILTKAEALAKASQLGLDLIEVASNADPPVARILDFQKFRYGEIKKEKAAKKHAKEVQLKEIWLSPRIAQYDLNVRLKRAEDFLKKGSKIKFTVKFRGREMIHPENGHRVVEQMLNHFGDQISVEREAKFEGRNLTVIIAAQKGGKQESESNA